MARVFQVYSSDAVTEDILAEAAKLFSEHYANWASNAAARMGSFARQGARVKLSPQKLKELYLTENATYVRATEDGEYAGHAITCRWKMDDKVVCWITQLVVHREFRERGFATDILEAARRADDDVYGIMSAHPAACIALFRANEMPIHEADLEFMKNNAQAIIATAPVSYVRDAKLTGTLFDADHSGGAVASVNTGFFISHRKVHAYLAHVRLCLTWPLGKLLDGHEWLVILPATRRASSTSQSPPPSE